MYMISATGLNPVNANPIAVPAIAISEIGVSHSFGAEFLQEAPRDLVGASENADLFAEENYVGIA